MTEALGSRPAPGTPSAKRSVGTRRAASMQDTLSEGTARAAQLAPSAVTAGAVGGPATRGVVGRVSPTTRGSSRSTRDCAASERLPLLDFLRQTPRVSGQVPEQRQFEVGTSTSQTLAHCVACRATGRASAAGGSRRKQRGEARRLGRTTKFGEVGYSGQPVRVITLACARDYGPKRCAAGAFSLAVALMSFELTKKSTLWHDGGRFVLLRLRVVLLRK